MTTSKKIALYILTAIIAIALAAGLFVYQTFYQPVVSTEVPKRIFIDQDDTIDSVFHKIKTTLQPTSMRGITWASKYYDYDQHIRTGCFTIQPSFSSLQLIRKLKVGSQTPVNLVIKGVRTPGQMASNLAKQLMLDSAAIARVFTDSLACSQLGFTTTTFPCMVIPNTYEVYWNMSSKQLFARLKKEYTVFWNEKRRKQAEAIGLSPMEISILASIVEEETKEKNDMRMVAGLYLNRLRRGMLLQADPTVKFALNKLMLQRIYNKDLTIDSPYNTYLYAGLPPGPIRFPSIISINSVLNYAQHRFLYMCAKEDFSGTHNFAVTLREHVRNAKRYWAALNRRKIK
ncbi:MAG: endolytic transglycosylase MltG [Bacteroidaceae bacterium]|nr:endolytic transglycosylase MltG [Bacteroidaceae bacterium]